jgi:hypothetical protein
MALAEAPVNRPHVLVQGVATFKAGYASTGLNRGRLALPLYDSKGNLAAYCGRAIKEESPKLIFPNGTKPEDFIFNANQVAEGELYLVRDPLEVLRAVASGVSNAVCFLTDTDQRKIETFDFVWTRRRLLLLA